MFIKNQSSCFIVPSDDNTSEDIRDDTGFMLKPSENVSFQSTFFIFRMFPSKAILKN